MITQDAEQNKVLAVMGLCLTEHVQIQQRDCYRRI